MQERGLLCRDGLGETSRGRGRQSLPWGWASEAGAGRGTLPGKPEARCVVVTA